MNAGYVGTFVISSSQVEISGRLSAKPELIQVGATWRWQGEPLCVDGANSLIRLGVAEGTENLRRKAGRMVRRMFQDSIEKTDTPNDDDDDVGSLWRNRCFTITDGYQKYTLTLLEPGSGRIPLFMSVGPLPPRDQDLWVVEGLKIERQVHDVDEIGAGVICFMPDTLIRTANGDVPIETLRAGDRIQTQDNGEQEIRWIGHSRLSGARLFAMPALRPICIRKGALIGGGPDRDLLVSPEHRVLMRGAGAQVLFNTDEVLVAARDLINGRSVYTDHQSRSANYIHLMLNSHEIIWANGIETESFHPAMTRLDTLDEDQRSGLYDIYPELKTDPNAYGHCVRRILVEPEAALLRHERAVGY